MSGTRQHFDPERYVETDQLARMLRVSRRTLWRRLRAGTIPRPTQRTRPLMFDVEAIIGQVAPTDPWLSCTLAGELARLRAFRLQWRRLGGEDGAGSGEG